MRKETCADVAREVDLGAVLKLGRSEMMSGGRRKQALLGDAMEAVIAAVYLDGGFEAAARHGPAALGQADRQRRGGCARPEDSLQEWAQARGLQPADLYRDRPRTGPDHAPDVHHRGAARKRRGRDGIGQFETRRRTGGGKGAARQAGGPPMIGEREIGSFEALFETVRPCRSPWWVIGPAAAALYGIDVGELERIDVVIAPGDARALEARIDCHEERRHGTALLRARTTLELSSAHCPWFSIPGSKRGSAARGVRSRSRAASRLRWARH